MDTYWQSGVGEAVWVKRCGQSRCDGRSKSVPLTMLPTMLTANNNGIDADNCGLNWTACNQVCACGYWCCFCNRCMVEHASNRATVKFVMSITCHFTVFMP